MSQAPSGVLRKRFGNPVLPSLACVSSGPRKPGIASVQEILPSLSGRRNIATLALLPPMRNGPARPPCGSERVTFANLVPSEAWNNFPDDSPIRLSASVWAKSWAAPVAKRIVPDLSILKRESALAKAKPRRLAASERVLDFRQDARDALGERKVPGGCD